MKKNKKIKGKCTDCRYFSIGLGLDKEYPNTIKCTSPDYHGEARYAASNGVRIDAFELEDFNGYSNHCGSFEHWNRKTRAADEVQVTVDKMIAMNTDEFMKIIEETQSIGIGAILVEQKWVQELIKKHEDIRRRRNEKNHDN